MTPRTPITEVKIENNKISTKNTFSIGLFLFIPIKSFRLVKYKIPNTVAGKITALNTCDTTITKTGLALNTGTTRPNSEIKSTMTLYFGNVIFLSELL